MAQSRYWADNYIEKKASGSDAIGLIKPGQRVFIGSSCGEPQHLVRELAESADQLQDIEIVRLLALETTPLSLIATKTQDQTFNIRSFYLGSVKPKALARNQRFITPINCSAIPLLFRTRRLPINVALVQTCPPDDFGWMSLGVSVDITLSAALSADLVIAQVNPRMPRVLGRSFIHVNDVDVIVEYEEDILTVAEPPEMESANEIGRLIAGLVEDGSTIQISPGASTQAILLGLSNKKDLGIHTGYFTDGIMHLVSKGVVTNRRKGHKEGRMVASAAIGSKNLYEFLDNNPVVDFEPTDFVYDPTVIARHHKMVSMIVAEAVDLTGQVAADALPYNLLSGITGIVDFVRGAAMAPGGKSILMLSSTSHQGTKSRIVPLLTDTIVVVPRGDIHYVVSEYGVVNLFGKSLQERAMAMISIAHPKFRDQLFQKAKEMGLLGSKRTLAESIHGIYPRKLEEVIDRDGQIIRIRPAKPDDLRRIQEHFYELDKKDVVARFFHEKNRFGLTEVEGVSQVDYVKDLTLLALVGEIGFDKVVAVAEYLLEPTTNLAEVAFSVSRSFQGKGLGKLLIRKLADAARENGIAGLLAYTAPTNTGMVRIFNSLPYKVHNSFEEDVLKLTCRFE